MRPFFLLVFLFCFVFTATAEQFILNPKKARIVDGDSVDYGGLHFRLCGINAPERNHPLYKWTTDNLRALLKQRRRIVARVVDIDKYNRKVAVMFIRGDKTSANEQMVKQGAAKHFRRYSANCEPLIKIRDLDKAEKHARRQKIGIWRR